MDTHQFMPAIISPVMHITSEDFWMSSCGGWQGSTKFCLDFQDLKLTCTRCTPTEQPFDNDFATTIKNLDNITKLTKHFGQQKGLIVNNNHKIKFRHVLFKVNT